MPSRRKRRKNAARKSDRTHHAERLHKKQGGRCYWCDVPVAIVRKIHQSQRLEVTQAIVKTRDGRVQWIATIDHLAGIKTRAARQWMVIACEPCNRKRAAKRGFIRFLAKRRTAVLLGQWPTE